MMRVANNRLAHSTVMRIGMNDAAFVNLKLKLRLRSWHLRTHRISGLGNRAHLITHDQPIVVTIVDTEAKIQELLPVLEDMMHTGVMAISDVEVLRVRRTPKE
jgi:hypothetical protein